MISDNMNREVKFGMRSEALANITKASSKTTLPFPCFFETGHILLGKFMFSARFRAIALLLSKKREEKELLQNLLLKEDARGSEFNGERGNLKTGARGDRSFSLPRHNSYLVDRTLSAKVTICYGTQISGAVDSSSRRSLDTSQSRRHDFHGS
ncbi:MAG: hypothetical protein EAZ39_20300 [Oscillatoriales cyanobacterium]|nr:MAG: hypothetical protein EAZ45_13160 [Oscillatoriales cyanobacterium]TAG15584.1 MAG: hypothetical protein EAZ39_20300 [Oscillatoriales cyanobacterium]TAG37627.1 MAG: hypothetical protein EAZ33_21260 [Oscillatoriales cyanobacterium]